MYLATRSRLIYTLITKIESVCQYPPFLQHTKITGILGIAKGKLQLNRQVRKVSY